MAFWAGALAAGAGRRGWAAWPHADGAAATMMTSVPTILRIGDLLRETGPTAFLA